mmetsp:Transcript_10650/g.14586  ORF Transcript_10650/g.14586 Transcript_10650/m.14586 type:complete len:417 (-) Transcript_10650:13-1263(-)
MQRVFEWCADKATSKGYSWCTEPFCNDVYYSEYMSKGKESQLKAAEGISMAFLIAGIVWMGILLFFEVISQRESTKNNVPTWFNKIQKFFCLLSLPLQVTGITLWVVLFPFYKELSGGYENHTYEITFMTIGTGLVLMLCSVIVCLVGSVITALFQRQSKLDDKENKQEEIPDPDKHLTRLGSYTTVILLFLVIVGNLWVQVDFNWYEVHYEEYSTSTTHGAEPYSVNYTIYYGLHSGKPRSHIWGDLPVRYEDIGFISDEQQLLIFAGCLISAILSIGMFVMASMILLEVLSVTQKYVPTWFGKVRTFACLIAVPFQAAGIICWIAIFPFRDTPGIHSGLISFYGEGAEPHYEGLQLSCGRNLIGLIVFCGMCAVGQVIVWLFGRAKKETDLPHSDKEDEEMQTTTPMLDKHNKM